jgi:hypothetical protein
MGLSTKSPAQNLSFLAGYLADWPCVFFVGLVDVQPGSQSLPQHLIVGVIHASYGGFHKWGYPKMYGL